MTDTIRHVGRPESGVPSRPASILRLETALETAFHAFDQDGDMSCDHRRRVLHDLQSELVEAAGQAARQGLASWAEELVRNAAGAPPRWAHDGSGWLVTIDVALAALVPAFD